MSVDNLTLDARTEQLDAAMRFIDEELTSVSCPEAVIGQIELAVEEIFMNITNYAYSGEPGKIEIFVKKRNVSDPKTIMITISDNGKPFNPLSVAAPDTDSPLDERTIGGLGIFLVKKVMSSVTYAYKNGYNHLIMSKTW